MSKKTIALLVIITLFPVLLYLLWPSDEARIRNLVRESALAFGNEDIDGVMKYISFGYSDDYGLSYVLIKQNFERQFKLYSEIEVECENLEITVTDETASARMVVMVLATLRNQRGYIFGDLKTPAEIALELEKNPTGKWLITKAAAEFAENLM